MTDSADENSASDVEGATQSTMSTMSYPPKPANVPLKERYIDYFSYTDARLDELELYLEPRGICVDLYMGYCVRLKPAVETENKVYMNICHCDELPPPSEVLLSVEKPRKEDFVRLPISISEPHLEEDEEGGFCEIFDLAVNSVFFWNIVVKSVSCQKVIVLMGIDMMFKRFKVAVSPYVMGSMNVPFYGSVYSHYIKRIPEINKCDKDDEEPFVETVEDPEIYYKELMYLLLNISDDPNAKCPCGTNHLPLRRRNPPANEHIREINLPHIEDIPGINQPDAEGIEEINPNDTEDIEEINSNDNEDIEGINPNDNEDIEGINPIDTEDIPGINQSDTEDIAEINPNDTKGIPGINPIDTENIPFRAPKRRSSKRVVGTSYRNRRSLHASRCNLVRPPKLRAFELVHRNVKSLPNNRDIPVGPSASGKNTTVELPVDTDYTFVKSESVFETDKRLTEKVLEPKSIETSEACSSNVTLLNQNQTKVKFSSWLSDNLYPEGNSNNNEKNFTKDIPVFSPKQNALEKPTTEKFQVNPDNTFVKSETVFETDIRLAGNMLEPKNINTYKASSSSTTLSNKCSSLLRNYHFPESNSDNNAKLAPNAKDIPVHSPTQRASGNPATVGFSVSPATDGFSVNPATVGFPVNPATTGFPVNPATPGFPVNPATDGFPVNSATARFPVNPENTFRRSGTVFKTDKRLAEKVEEPNRSETSQASSSSSTLPNRNPPKIKLTSVFSDCFLRNRDSNKNGRRASCIAISVRPPKQRISECTDNTFVKTEALSSSTNLANRNQKKLNLSRLLQGHLSEEDSKDNEERSPHTKNVLDRSPKQRVSGTSDTVGNPVYPKNTSVRSETGFETDKRLAKPTLEPRSVDKSQASSSSATLPSRNQTKIKLFNMLQDFLQNGDSNKNNGKSLSRTRDITVRYPKQRSLKCVSGRPASIRIPARKESTLVRTEVALSDANLPNRRQTQIKLSRMLQDNLTLERNNNNNVKSCYFSSIRGQNGMPIHPLQRPIPPNNQIRVPNHPIKIPNPPDFYPSFGYMLGPEGKYFDLPTYFAVVMCEDKSKDTPNMAYIRDIRLKWGDNHHIIQGILKNPYPHLKGDNDDSMIIFENALRPLVVRRLPSFSFASKSITVGPTAISNPVSGSVDVDSTLSVATVPTLPTLIPGSKNLYAFTENPLPPVPCHLSSAPEIQLVDKKAAERRLTKLLQAGHYGAIALKSAIELYDAGEIYLFITAVSTRKYKELNVFATMDRIIAFKKGIYFTEVKLPKPIISKRGRAHVCNGFLMIVLPIARNDG